MNILIFLIVICTIVFLGDSFLSEILALGIYQNNPDANSVGAQISALREKLPSELILRLSVLILAIISGIIIAKVVIKCIKRKNLLTNEVGILRTLYVVSYGVVFVAFRGITSSYNNFGFEGVDLSAINSLVILLLLSYGFVKIPDLVNDKSNILPYLTEKKGIMFYVVVLVGTFQMIGNSLFFSGNEAWNMSATAIACFILFSYILAVNVLLFLQKLGGFVISRNENVDNQKTTLRKILICELCIELIYLIACNPGVMTNDSIDALEEITGLSGFTNAFPALLKIIYSGLVGWISNINMIGIVISMIQIILYITFMYTFSKYLLEKGVSTKWVFVGNLVFTILPNIGFFVITFGSNFYFTISMCWFTYFLVRLIDDRFYFRSVKRCVGLLVSLVCIFFTRNEGFALAYAGMVLVFVLGLFRKNYRLLVVSVASVAAILFIRGPIFNLAGVEMLGENENPVNSVSTDLIEAVVFYDGTIEAEDRNKLLEYGTLEEYKEAFCEFAMDNYPQVTIKLRSDGDASMQLFLREMKNNFWVYVRARLNKADIIWNVTEAKGNHSSRVSTSCVENEIGVVRHTNILTVLLTKCYYWVSILIPLADVVLYRTGLYLFLSFVMILYCIYHNCKEKLILFIPFWVHSFILMCCLLWQGTRHVLCLNMSFLIAFLAIVCQRNNTTK